MWLPLTPLDFYRRSRRLFPGKTAVVDQGRKLGFAAFGDRVERLAGGLRALGLKPREPVSVLAPNTHQLLESFYGIPLAGGVVHPVNPRLAPLEIGELLNHAGARVLAFHGDLARVVREIVGTLKAVERFVVFEGDPRQLDFPVLDYEALLERAVPHAPDFGVLDEDAPMALFHTSGGAAKPRGVLLSHRSLALHALYAVIAMGLCEDDVSLCSVPFAYMNGGGNPQINLAVGATAVLARRTDPETLAALLEEERATVWITAPKVLRRLLQSPALERRDVSRLRLVLVGGAPVTRALIGDAEDRLGARCVEVYGLTETSPFVAAAGLPVLGVETRVADEAGREVTADGESVGEVLVRGNGVMTAYHRDPDRTQEALRGGWLHTGDLASLGREGELRWRGRTQDAVSVDGRIVSAGEIEAVLATHPDVRECAVIAAPDPDRGEVPVGLVVLNRGAHVTESDLVEHARRRLPAFEVPRRIEFLPSLPKSEAGEVLKSELRTLYARA